jgi:hypothetical protein
MSTRPRRYQAISALLAATALIAATPTAAALGQTTTTTSAAAIPSTTSTLTATTTPPPSNTAAPPPTSTTTPSAAAPAPQPKLALNWTVLTRECSTTTKTKAKKRVKKKVRVCAQRPVRAHGRALHLHWRQRGEVFGHLTLANQPVPNAMVYIQSTIRGWNTKTTTVVTNAKGRFSAIITGPNKTIRVTYSPGPGTLLQVEKKVQATAYLSLKVGHLAAGHTAHLAGIVFGGHIPQDLYIQFWYYAGPAGWQPFSHLAIVNRHNGHWSTGIPIPRASRGYRYEIKAIVVRSPDWPWSQTKSRIVTRVVS